jgi:hypothetical protein
VIERQIHYVKMYLTFFSAPIQQQCVKLIDLYMEEIIDMFVKDYTPEQVCAELHLCAPKVVEIDPEVNEVSAQVNFN